MKVSPFPGLDPYLEPFWSGVHNSLLTHFRNQLQDQLPDGLWADVEETVVVESAPGSKSWLKPDAAVFDAKPWESEPNTGTADIAVAEPLIVQDTVERTERCIVIIDTTTGDEVVTAIELLSPANKLGTDNRARYIAKRDAYHATGTNFVEIDLIRSGEHIVGAPIQSIPDEKRGAPIVSVHRAVTLTWEIYPVSLRELLPTFRVPLRPCDSDVVIQLQSAFDENYRHGGYGNRVDYAKEPEPRFCAEDALWADELLREKGLRS